MNEQNQNDREHRNDSGWFSRERVGVLILVAASLITFYLCYLMLEPFLPALAWALAMAVVTGPIHRWVARRIRHPGTAAAVSVVIVLIIIVVPTAFVVQNLVSEAASGVRLAQDMLAAGRWRQALLRYPQFAPVVTWIETQVDVPGILNGTAAGIASYLSSILSGSVTAILGVVITFFSLFYFFRDRDQTLKALRSLIPLSQSETSTVFRRISDTIHATVYGTLAVSAVQGVLGGLMFWWLGLPAPILWGTMMALLGLLPIFGASLVWAPAAILLALEGDWTKAIILTAWGGTVISVIDNLLYPIFVGKRIRLHTLPVFFSILGGLAAFGASGLIVGPIILAVADALIHVWRQRTAHGRTAEG
jgi:predicted PurR-regulated permease PerM